MGFNSGFKGLSYKLVQHVTGLNTVGNCNTMISIIILWDHRYICRPSLTETSLCGAYLLWLGQLKVLKPILTA